MKREEALTWWNKLSLEEKFYKTINANKVIIGDHTRHPDTLTGREIEDIYRFNVPIYKECINCSQPFTDKNVYSQDGWKETQISGMCEQCFDITFDDEANGINDSNNSEDVEDEEPAF